MATNKLFQTSKTTTTKNNAGGEAIALSDKEALANLVCSGMLGGTFYIDAQSQLKEITDRLPKVDPVFLAKLAIYARNHGFMKDTPALILAFLATYHPEQFTLAAPKVLDRGKMIMNLVQILRSGQFGRKSLPRPARKAIRNYLLNQKATKLLNDSIGNKPSLADIIKMVHPKPISSEQEALFKFILGKDVDQSSLPAVVSHLIDFRSGRSSELPSVDHRLLDNGKLTTNQWGQIALSMGHTALRMNLNTLLRHGVFNNSSMVQEVAAKLRDRDLILRSKVFPYQLLTAFQNIDASMPASIREALQDAMEIATENIPELEGKWVLAVDVSGSMRNPISGVKKNPKTGRVETHTTKTKYVDAAALMASSFLRKNKGTLVLPFDTELYTSQSLNPRDSIMTNATKLASFGGGGTYCHLPVQYLNLKKIQADGIIFISDNESHRSFHNYYYGFPNEGPQLHNEWERFYQNNPNANMICIDIAGGITTQVKGQNVSLISGFSDSIFEIVSNISAKKNAKSLVDLIESTQF